MLSTDLNAAELYSRFTSIKLGYATRNGQLDDLQDFFDGDQWEEDEDERDEEEVRLTLNYARRSVLWHVAYLVQAPPRIDVPTSPAVPDPGAARREKYLRAVAGSSQFRRVHRRIEISANKYGYAVLQALWSPPKGQPTTQKATTIEGSTAPTAFEVYTKVPFVFRALDPRKFYPVYRTYDYPDDFLYVFRFDPDRLIEDIEDKFGVDLAPTLTRAQTPGGVCDLLEYWDDTRYVLMAITMEVVREEGSGKRNRTRTEYTPHVLEDKKHPYGRPPFFVLPNVIADPEADPTDGGSLSEVDLIEGVNKHLNLMMSLAATEIATRIHPPTAYKSDDHLQKVSDIRMGAGEVIPIGAEEELLPLSWQGIPHAVTEHRNAIMQTLRDLSGLPKTSFGESEGSSGASGVGMRLAYAALELMLALKVPEREEFFTELFAFILSVTEGQLSRKEGSRISFWTSVGGGKIPVQVLLTEEDIGEAHYCVVKYGNLLPRNKVEWEQHVVYLYKTGVTSLRTALELLDDVEDPDAEIERIRLEHRDVALHPDIAAAIKALEQPPPEAPAQPLAGQQPGAGAGSDLKFNAAPPVPTFPSTPTQRNAPFLARGQVPNMGQLGQKHGMGPGHGPGVNVGPPIEEQM